MITTANKLLYLLKRFLIDHPMAVIIDIDNESLCYSSNKMYNPLQSQQHKHFHYDVEELMIESDPFKENLKDTIKTYENLVEIKSKRGEDIFAIKQFLLFLKSQLNLYEKFKAKRLNTNNRTGALKTIFEFYTNLRFQGINTNIHENLMSFGYLAKMLKDFKIDIENHVII